MKPLLAACALAFGLTLAYAAYLQPEWEPSRNDQFEYLALARGLALRGELTRAAPEVSFYPEWLRSPGYPLALAPLCRMSCANWPVAIAQAFGAAGVVLLTFRLACSVLPRRAALVAAFATAATPALAYFAALPLAEILTTLLLCATLAVLARARDDTRLRWAIACGALSGALALTRPLFIPFAIVAALFLLPRPRAALALVATAALVLAPWVAYSQTQLGRPLAGSAGLVLWLGYFQGLTGGQAADRDAFTTAARDPDGFEVTRATGAHIGLDATESREAAAALRELAAFVSMPDPIARARAYGPLNDSLAARALRLIAHDPAGWLARGIGPRGLELLAHDEPYRVRDAPAVPLAIPAALMALQLIVIVLASYGAIALVRARTRAALPLLAAIAFVLVLSLPFQTESRYALPVRPLLLVLAVAGATALRPPLAVGKPVRA